jgi:magnesium-transporting ATPase (P-type)
MNIMTVVETWRYGGNDGDNTTTITSASPTEPASPDIRQDRLRLCMGLCNSAHFVRSDENMALPIKDRAVMGDATETALLRHIEGTDGVDALRAAFPPVLEVPFNSDRKWAAGIFNFNNQNIVFLKVRICSNVATCGAHMRAKLNLLLDMHRVTFSACR